MSRREFSEKVRKAALARCGHRCEGLLAGSDERCPSDLRKRKFHFDHDLPDWFGGEPTLENCRVLCVECHHDKTAGVDIPAIAKAKRINLRDQGYRKVSRLQGQGFRKSSPQRSASRPLRRKLEGATA